MKPFRLEKRKMIKSSREFNKIYTTGNRIKSQHFLILSVEAAECRFGFTVSRTIKGSVARNFAKRRLREMVRMNQEHLPQKKHLVFQALTGVNGTDFEALTAELVRLLEKLKK